MAVQHTFSSPEATAAFAKALAPTLRKGDTVLLEGAIGAGKTHFARSLIQARLATAGRMEDVPSPTFTLIQTYDDGQCELWHADLYRLTHSDEVEELGLTDAFDAAICLVEWPDRLGDLAPTSALTLEFSATETLGERLLIARGDARWNEQVKAALNA